MAKRAGPPALLVGLVALAAAFGSPSAVFGQSAVSGDEAASLETVTVQAERPDWERILSPGTVDVIVPDDFRGEQKRLPEYLETVPGLHIERRGGEGQYSTAVMRGSTSAQVNIYVDGVPQNLGGDSGIDLSLIPMNNVARIEVFRGYIPTRFAGAPVGGVINIITRKPQGYGAAVSAGVRSFNGRTGDATLIGPLFGGSLLLGAHRDESRGDFKYDFIPYRIGPNNGAFCGGGGAEPSCGRRRQSNSWENTDVLLKWQDDNWFVRGALKRTDRYHPNPTNGASQMGFLTPDSNDWVDVTYSNTLHRYQKVDQYDLVVGRRQTWGDLDFGLEAQYMRQSKGYYLMDPLWDPAGWSNFVYFGAGELWTSYDTERYGLALDASYRLGDRHLLEFRADFFTEELALDGNPTAPKNYYQSGGYFYSVYSRKTWHAQLSDTVTLNDRKDLWLTLILRYDQASDKSNVINYFFKHKTNTDGAFTWGLALKKEIGDTWTIRATGGSFVRYPNLYELYGDGLYIKPGTMANSEEFATREYGHMWDFGIEWRGNILDTRTNLSATWFHRRTDNMIFPQMNRVNHYLMYVNAGLTESFGTELEASFRRGGFDLNASATWLQSKYLAKEGFGIDIDEGRRIPFNPDWEAHVRASYRLFNDALTIFAEHHFTDGETDWSIRSSKNWSERRRLNVTGFGARYNTPWGLVLTAGVDDVFNNRPKQLTDSLSPPYYTVVLSHGQEFPSPGRTWYLTLDYAFGGGSAFDSSGEGSADPRPAATAFPDGPAAAQTSGKPTPFYVAAKLIYTKQTEMLSDRPGALLRPGWIIHQSYWPWGVEKENTGSLPAMPGGSIDNSYFGGGLALGVDLHEVNGWPIRMELELGTHQDGRVEWPGVPPRNDSAQAYSLAGKYGVNGIYLIEGGSFTQLNYRSHHAFFNLFFDFHNRSRFTPYIGAGAGISFIRTKLHTQLNMAALANSYGDRLLDVGMQDYYEVQRKLNFAWNATAGVSYELTDNIELDLSYRYVDNGYDEKSLGYPETFIDYYPPDPKDWMGERYMGTYSYDGADVNLREAHQAVMALRFSF